MNNNTPENKLEVKNEQVQNTPITQNAPESKAIESSPPIKSEENQANWKAFREQREQERRAKEVANKRAIEKEAEANALRAALEAITNKPSNNRQNDSHSDDNEETEEQRIDKRVNQIIKQREDEAEKKRRQRDSEELPNKLVSTFNDFNQVCSSENLDYLEFHYPEVASAFKRAPEDFDKWSSIYKAVKRFVPNLDSRKDQQKAEKNLSKPGSISTPGVSHGANAMPSARLDEQKKAANWERMQKTIKGLS